MSKIDRESVFHWSIYTIIFTPDRFKLISLEFDRQIDWLKTISGAGRAAPHVHIENIPFLDAFLSTIYFKISKNIIDLIKTTNDPPILPPWL